MSNHHLKMIKERGLLARYSLFYLLASISILIIFKTAAINGWKSHPGVYQKSKKPHISVNLTDIFSNHFVSGLKRELIWLMNWMTTIKNSLVEFFKKLVDLGIFSG